MAWYKPWEEIERVYKKVVREVSRPEFYMTAAGAAAGALVGGAVTGGATRYSVPALGGAALSGTGAAIGAGVGYSAGGGLAGIMTPPPMPPSPTSLGPAPTTVMATERAEAARGQLKKRRRLTAMNRDYGALNLQTEQLGT